MSSIQKIEHALLDLRHGRPVLLKTPARTIAVLAAEEANTENITLFPKPITIITKNRAQYLFNTPAPQAIENSDITTIHQLAGTTLNTSYTGTTRNAKEIEQQALELIKLTELLPAAIISTTIELLEQGRCTTVTPDDITHYKTNITVTLTQAVEAPLTLKHAPNASIIAFRPNTGGREHYAIIIGDARNSAAPLVRVHSSCYTGDLLGSLACDCGDQLQSAIQQMGEHKEGGIILYLLQEGRGIGLTNKLRTYQLQHHGLDTVEANENLGFEDDQRLFLPAAKMLQELGINTISLLTNNPRKAKGLEQHHITVNQCIPHIMQTNKHNVDYLATKEKKLGHTFSKD